MYSRTDKPDPLLFSCPIVVSLKVLSIGPHVHEKDGGIKVMFRVLLGYDGFFNRIHTAYGRAVRVVTAVDIP